MRRTLVLAAALAFAFARCSAAASDAATAFPRQVVAPSGLRTWQFPGGEGAGLALVVLVGVGSRDEDDGRTGLAHVVEHCIFRGPASRSTEDLLAALREHRVAFNGHTTSELTTFELNAPAEDWEWLVATAGEMIASPAFRETDVAPEIEIVLEEIKGRAAHASGGVIESVVYPHHPLGRSVGGRFTDVKGLTASDVAAFHRAHYRAGRVTVAWSGRVDPSACDAAIARAFGGLPAGVAPGKREPPDALTGPRVLRTSIGAQEMDAPGVLVVGQHVEPDGPQGWAARHVLAALLRDALWKPLRTDEPLAYFTDVGFTTYADAWRLEFMAQVADPSKLPRVLAAFDNTCASLSAADADHIDAARSAVLGAMDVHDAESLRDATSVAWSFVQAGAAAPDVRRAVEEVTDADVREVARRTFVPERRYLLTNDPRVLPGFPWPITLAAGAIVVLVIVSSLGLVSPRRMALALRSWAGDFRFRLRGRAERKRAEAEVIQLDDELRRVMRSESRSSRGDGDESTIDGRGR